MSIGNEYRRESRLTENVGTVLVFLGVVGVLAAITLTIWALRDLSNEASQIGAVVKIQLVALVGTTPALLSLLVIAAGVHLQTRAPASPPRNAVASDDDHDFAPETDDEPHA